VNTYCDSRFSRPARLFSLVLLDGLRIRLRRPRLREATADVGLSRLATAFMNKPGYQRRSAWRSIYRNGESMKPRVTVIALAVDNLERALTFYRDGLGFPTQGIVGTEFEHGAAAFF
jgi:hypothetical protein